LKTISITLQDTFGAIETKDQLSSIQN